MSEQEQTRRSRKQIKRLSAIVNNHKTVKFRAQLRTMCNRYCLSYFKEPVNPFFTSVTLWDSEHKPSITCRLCATHLATTCSWADCVPSLRIFGCAFEYSINRCGMQHRWECSVENKFGEVRSVRFEHSISPVLQTSLVRYTDIPSEFSISIYPRWFHCAFKSKFKRRIIIPDYFPCFENKNLSKLNPVFLIPVQQWNYLVVHLSGNELRSVQRRASIVEVQTFLRASLRTQNKVCCGQSTLFFVLRTKNSKPQLSSTSVSLLPFFSSLFAVQLESKQFKLRSFYFQFLRWKEQIRW